MNYNVVELGEVAEITKLAGFEFSKYIKYNDSGEIIALRAMNVKNGTLNLENIKRIDKSVSDTLTRSKLYKNDIVMTYTGSNFGDAAIIKENDKFHLAPNIAKITIKDGNNPYFFFSYIRSDYFRQQLNNYVGGSSQPTIPMKTIRKIEVPLPQIQEQEKIANILSSLDDKIQLNNEMNKTLEEMAQSIFKRWFVDFEFPNEDGEPYKSSGGEMVDSELGMIPKGWEVTELREIFVFKKGKKPKEILNIKEDEQYKKYLTIDVLNQKSKLYATVDKMIECSNDDILMVMDGASSGSIYTGMNGIVASTLAKLEVKNSILKPYIYQLLKYKEVDIKCHLTGSAIPHTDKAYIHSQKVALPKNLEELKTMNKILKYIMDKIRINKVEVEKLRITRDTLLPKLMSGEIKVN